MRERPPAASTDDHPPLAGFLHTFPWLWRTGTVLAAVGFSVLWIPWREPQSYGLLLLITGFAIVLICLLCEIALNQVYWKSKRREQRLDLAEAAGKRRGRKQVWITKISERDAGDGGTLIEVRKEVRKRVPR